MKLEEWDISEEQFRAVLRELRFKYHKWDAYAVGRCLILPASLVLPERDHRELIAAAENYHRLLGRLEEGIARRVRLLRKLAIPRALDGLIECEPGSRLQLARYDFFQQPDGHWMISEFNEDVPGGFNEAVGLPRLVSLRGTSCNELLRERFVEAFPAGAEVVLWYATGYSEDLQHMVILQDWLTESGRSALLASPAHLRARWSGFRARGRKVSWGARFYPAEWLPWLPNLREWCALKETGRVMNPVRRLIRQSKKIMALVHREEDGVLDPDERGAFRRNTPWSDWAEQESLRRAAEAPADWVLKRAFGRMGDAVVMGCLQKPDVWTKALAEAAREPEQHTVQRRFPVRPLPWDGKQWYPTVGVYLVNGKFAGYYSRVAEEPMIDHRSYHVTTVVEDT